MCHMCVRAPEGSIRCTLPPMLDRIRFYCVSYEPRFNTPRDDRDTYFCVYVREYVYENTVSGQKSLVPIPSSVCVCVSVFVCVCARACACACASIAIRHSGRPCQYVRNEDK